MAGNRYCNDLCTMQTKGYCRLCDLQEEADRFVWKWCGGWIWAVLRNWIRGSWDSLTGRNGYRVIPIILAAYVGIYTVLEARHERQMNRAVHERNTFMAMVSSGDRGDFITGMKRFGPTQMISVHEEPLLFEPLNMWNLLWGSPETPNEEFLNEWGKERLASCTYTDCGNDEKYRIDLEGADMRGANLEGFCLWRSNLEKAELVGANLINANLNLVGANMRGARLWDADLRHSNLRGTDLRGAFLSEPPIPLFYFDFIPRRFFLSWKEDQDEVCSLLTDSFNWEEAYRDEGYACGGSIPVFEERRLILFSECAYSTCVRLESKLFPEDCR